MNKKYNLCGDCVFEKSHDGKTRAQVYSERAAAKQAEVHDRMSKLYAPSRHKYIPNHQKPIKQQTKKEKEVKSKLSEIKTAIDMDEVQNGTYYCKGCGHSKVGLDKSHILAVGQRKDLELDKNNMRLHCRNCHMDWESNDIVRMVRLQCFEDDLQYIFVHDYTVFSKIMTKIDEYLVWETPDNQLVTKLKKIKENFENCC